MFLRTSEKLHGREGSNLNLHVETGKENWGIPTWGRGVGQGGEA